MVTETESAPSRIAPSPKVGMVSLGCPKALVDSERILTRLRADGYAMSPDYAGADVVLVNTCGFLDSAKEESLQAIGEAIAENGRVIVTGCMGEEADAIRAAHPQVLAVTGAHQYEQVVDAVHTFAPPSQGPFVDLIPQPDALKQRSDCASEYVKLTPRHYSYLKISEGCNHSCAFCIIPDLRGKLASRRIDAVLRDHRRFSSDQTASPNYEHQRRVDELDKLLTEAGLESVTRDRLKRAVEEPSLLGLDPPDHTRLRSLVNKAFTPKQVEASRPRIEAVVDELLDAVEDGRVDMMEALADPLPTIVIAELIGVPIEDRDRFKLWSAAVARQRGWGWAEAAAAFERLIPS